jgi:hypothetical protein
MRGYDTPLCFGDGVYGNARMYDNQLKGIMTCVAKDYSMRAKIVTSFCATSDTLNPTKNITTIP